MFPRVVIICAVLVVLPFLDSVFGQEVHAICNVQPDPKSSQKVTGSIKFVQAPGQQMSIDVDISGLDPVDAGTPDVKFLHGFHVHEYGDTTGGCTSTGGHFNPRGVSHGGPTDAVRHPGDFGNLKQDPSGQIVTSFHDPVATLFGVESIIGRAIVLHGGVDDLGKGGDAGSVANGNAGPRLGCCVIGYAKNV
ncbi:superoxide dismutase [Cu-Zn] [Aplysia californica]|uniref:Superoxide dismutase [Cu-Zn] n=1 Tax=Aplysia californica TaxID=6500 RepID=A0ABM1A7H6_APLCA|nr:superoxide dismutase [Cu-Zn] [Aplysia californica]